MRGQGENDNGTRRFQLPKTTNMGEITGTEDPRPIAAPCARETSSDVRVDVELAALVSSVETTLWLEFVSAGAAYCTSLEKGVSLRCVPLVMRRCMSSLCQSRVVGIIWLEWRQKLIVQISANTTHQKVSQLFTPTHLVETGNETLLGQWGLLRTRNGEGHLDGLYEGLDWVSRTLSSKK